MAVGRPADERPRSGRVTGALFGVAVVATAVVLWSPVVPIGSPALAAYPGFAQLTAFRLPLAVAVAASGLVLLPLAHVRVWGLVFVMVGLSPLPQILPRAFGHPAEAPAGASTLTVLSINVLASGADPAEIARLAVERRADVVSLPEASMAFAASVGERAAVLGVEYQRATDNPSATSSPFATSLLVRRELRPEFTVARIPSHLGSVTAVAQTPAGPVRVAAVHNFPPLPGHEDSWRDDHQPLARLCGRSGPMILAGDFNSTLDHPPLRSLLDAGCADAAATVGAGLHGTWPSVLPAFLSAPIDHVLLAGGAGPVTAFDVIMVSGPDHRGLLATIALAR